MVWARRAGASFQVVCETIIKFLFLTIGVFFRFLQHTVVSLQFIILTDAYV